MPKSPSTYWQQLKGDFPRWSLRVWLAALVVAVATYLLSDTTVISRLIYLATLLLGLFTGLLYLVKLIRRRPLALIPALAILIALITWIITAGRPPDIAGLRQEYLLRLQAFRGTVYIWGGETHVGVDCSGLARVALMEAMVVEGFKEGNPRLLGPMLWQFWWRDIGTRGMDEGAFGFTHHVSHAIKLTDGAKASLLPGDLAVDEHTHVLMYLGENRWIEANPDDHRVVINAAIPSSTRPYFNKPAHIVRWWVLDSRGGSASQSGDSHDNAANHLATNQG